eukprot:738022-Amphidinium_carterae.1
MATFQLEWGKECHSKDRKRSHGALDAPNSTTLVVNDCFNEQSHKHNKQDRAKTTTSLPGAAQ